MFAGLHMIFNSEQEILMKLVGERRERKTEQTKGYLSGIDFIFATTVKQFGRHLEQKRDNIFKKLKIRKKKSCFT